MTISFFVTDTAGGVTMTGVGGVCAMTGPGVDDAGDGSGALVTVVFWEGSGYRSKTIRVGFGRTYHL
jgi:hypothetical protein